MIPLPIKTAISIPFPTEELAGFAVQILSPDQELKPELVKRTLKSSQNNLIADFECIDVRMLRLCINSFLENTALIISTMQEFSLIGFKITKQD
ncbi:EKC/KEOPS complex subunit [Neolecta irregularis DAH-3]|uniref:EKC/KEOPS complex subunit n=1 Tax=Neolecta irregularis (strain DAH-3) TaxID=1198029 RepID=A0A1U7LNA4_NEOID|nr:EKC/KEOPS complex subunit [Neolecta irregularis DAH-3]|eukprot:OLL24119.1 EKC/KEOPS complex subunit [Neolecta irregularis DAH-3]